MENKSWMRPLVFFLMVTFVLTFYLYGGGEYLSLEFIQENVQKLRHLVEIHPVRVTAGFVGIYVLLTSLSIPGCLLLTLLAGAIFGTIPGTFWVMLSSTTGACVAFLLSRYLFREYFQKKFHDKFLLMNEKVKKEGKVFLFTSRMIPVSPFVVVNVVMGLTKMKLWNFAWITYLGMLPGTFLYVYAGRKIATLKNPSQILSLELILGLTMLGVLPLLLRWAMRNYGRKKLRYAHE